MLQSINADMVLAGDRGPRGHPGLSEGRTLTNSIQLLLKYLKNGSFLGTSIGIQFGCLSYDDLPQHSRSDPNSPFVWDASVIS